MNIADLLQSGGLSLLGGGEQMMNKSRPVVITFSILAGAQVLTNATGLSDVVDPKWIFLAGIIVAAVQTAMTFYVQNEVVPLEDTAAYVDTEGRTVAGPASPPQVLNGTSVEVKTLPVA